MWCFMFKKMSRTKTIELSDKFQISNRKPSLIETDEGEVFAIPIFTDSVISKVIQRYSSVTSKRVASLEGLTEKHVVSLMNRFFKNVLQIRLIKCQKYLKLTILISILQQN